MKNNKKTITCIIAFLIIIAISLVVFLKFYNKENYNSTDFIKINLEDASGATNNRPEITMDKNINGLLFNNINLSVYDDPNLSDQKVSVFEADVMNISGSRMENIKKKIVFKDKKGKEIASEEISIESIEPEERTSLHIQTFNDIINAYSFEVVDIQ